MLARPKGQEICGSGDHLAFEYILAEIVSCRVLCALSRESESVEFSCIFVVRWVFSIREQHPHPANL
jgi:hypothetical protein